jgi:hypothetical protein
MHALCYSEKYRYEALDKILAEVLHDIRALADYFLMALPNINNGSQSCAYKQGMVSLS